MGDNTIVMPVLTTQDIIKKPSKENVFSTDELITKIKGEESPALLEPSAEDLEKYRSMGVKQYRSPAGKLYNLTERELLPKAPFVTAPKDVRPIAPTKPMPIEGEIRARPEPSFFERVKEDIASKTAGYRGPEKIQALIGVESKAKNLAERFGKNIVNSFSKIGESIISSPFSPIQISGEIVKPYKAQATQELSQSGFSGSPAEARRLINQRAKDLAAFDIVPKLKTEPAQTISEKATNVVSGLATFIAQLAITKKILPKKTPDPIVWEVQNQLTGGLPGHGVAIRSGLGYIGKIPTGSIAGKIAKVAAESGLFAGITAAEGGKGEDIIISALIPAVFNAWNFQKQRSYVESYRKNLETKAIKSHAQRLQTGMNKVASEAHLKADMRIIENAVSKAKQTIYRDDAFAPSREKWQNERQKALDLIATGKPQNMRKGNDILEFLGAKEIGTQKPIEQQIKEARAATKAIAAEKMPTEAVRPSPAMEAIKEKPIKAPAVVAPKPVEVAPVKPTAEKPPKASLRDIYQKQKQQLDEVRVAINRIAPNIKIVLAHPNAKEAIRVDKSGKQIEIKADLLDKIREQFPDQETAMLEGLIEEELIHQEHIQQFGGGKKAERVFAKAWRDASPEEKQAVIEAGGGLKRDDAQMGAELLRMREQIKRHNDIVESLVPERKEAVKRAVDVLRTAIKPPSEATGAGIKPVEAKVTPEQQEAVEGKPLVEKLNYEQFASKYGYPTGADIMSESIAISSPSGKISKVAKKRAMDRMQENINKQREGRIAYKQAIIEGKVIDSEGKITKEKLFAEQKNIELKKAQSEIDAINANIKSIENLGSMSHKQTGELKAAYRKTIDEFNRRKKKILEKYPELQPAPTATAEKKTLISQTSNINAPYTKSTLNRLAGDIESISNFGKSLSTGDKRLSDFDIPTQTSMMRSMLASLHQPEIRNSIISPDTVDVVNNLIKIKFPTKISLHDKSMNKEPLLVNADGSISLRIDTADSLMKGIASATTKLKLRTFKSIRNSLDNLATSGTLDILSLPYEQTTTPVGAESASIALENRRAAMNKPATISTKAISHVVNIPQSKVESNINVLGEYKKSQEALAKMEKPAPKGKVIIEQGRRTYVPERGALERLEKPTVISTQELLSSVGASRSPELDRALQRAQRTVKTTYVFQSKGRWLNSKRKPQYGDYYEISAGQSRFVEGQKEFKTDTEAIRAAQYIAKSSNKPVYIETTSKGYVLVAEKPKTDYVKIMPSGPGLTREERAILSKQQIAEVELAQEKRQAVGFKAGWTEAIRESRNKLNEFRLAQQLTDKHRQDAADVVRQYVPKEQQYRYIQRILNAKTNKRIDNITTAINLYLNKAEQRAAKRDFVNFIKDLKSTYRRGEVPFGSLRNDVRKPIVEILKKYDLAKLSEEKKAQLQSRDEYIKRVAGTVADVFESLEDTGLDILQMPNARIEELNRLRKTHIGELDTEQIQYIQSSLGHLVKIAERKGDIKERVRAEKLSKLVNDAKGEVASKTKEVGVTKEVSGLFGFIPRLLTTANATPHTLTGYLTGKDNKATMELVADNLAEMTKDKHRIAKEFVESYRKMLKNAGINQSDDKILDKKIQITYGKKTFKATIDNLMGIYMDIRAEGNLQRILKTGRVFNIYERDPKYLYITASKEVRTGRPALQELRNIIDFVENQNPILKKLADIYFQHNFKVQTPIVNKTSMAYQNYELARKEKYWHMSRVMPVGVEGKPTDISVSIENQGRFLPRTGGRQPLRNISFRQGVVSNLQANAAFASMTIPMQDIKALISAKQWQDTVIRNGLKKELMALTTMLRRTQGMITSQDFVDMAGASLLNSFGKYALSLRLSGYGVQTASIPAAWEIIEPKYFIAPRSIANLPKIPIKAVREMMELSPTLWMRWTARQFDYVIGGVAAQNAYDNLMWADKSVTEKMLNQYTWGDQKAIYQIYLAAQEKVASETNLKRGTFEFKKQAIKITEDALETQPQWDVIYRNLLTSSPNILLRGSMMFQSARNAQWNVLLRAIDDYRKGRISASEAGKRTSGVMLANILVATVKRLVKMGIKYGWLGLLFVRADKEKKEKIGIAVKKDIKKEPKRIAINSALNFISLPAFGSFFQNIGYETARRIRYPNMQHRLQDIRTGNIFADLSLDVTGLAADIGLMAKYMITGERFESGPDKDKPKWKRSAKQVADQLAELIAMRTGLPYSAPKGEIYYQIKSAEKAVEKSMSNQELFRAYQKTKKKDGGVRANMQKRHDELLKEINNRKKQE